MAINATILSSLWGKGTCFCSPLLYLQCLQWCARKCIPLNKCWFTKNERKVPQDHFPARFITHAWGCSPIIHVSVWGTRWPASDKNAGWASIRRRPHAASKVSRPLKKISKSRLDLWTDTDPSTLLFAIFPFWHLTLSDTIILLSFSTWKAQGKPRNYQILIFEMDFQRYVRY